MKEQQHGGAQRHGPMGGPGRGIAEKPKNFKGALKKLFVYMRPYYALILTALICAVVSSIMTIIGPDKLSELIDLITGGMLFGIDMAAVGKICIFLVVIYGTGALLSLLQGLLMTNATQEMSRKMRGGISGKINRLPMSYFNRVSFGDVLSRVTNDVDTIGSTMQNSIVSLVSAVTLFIGCLIMMFVTNWVMAITAIGASLIGFVLMSVIMGASQKYFAAQQAWLGKINGHVEEAYSGHNLINVYNGQRRFKENFDRMNRELYNSNWKSQFFSGLMMPLMSFVGNFGYVAVCVVGALLTMNGQITFGVIVAFITYVRLFTSPLAQIAQAATSLQSTAAASERVFEFLDEAEMADESDKTRRLDTTRGDVQFEHVKFGYEPDKIIIRDFSEHIRPGEKIAIVGPTGAGKTTMVNLLMRFYELNSGSISIDGVPTSELTRANVHALFGMVLQDTWLFEGTIRENVVYGKTGVTDEQVEAACRAVGMHHFIRTLPNGYDTVLGDNVSLSAGQKQLLTIARAMVENAPMLILDEATSSVDTRTEVLIQRAMDALTAGRTSFVIAHRLSTIKNADLILVMRDGDIVESGTHEELIAKGGFYADLYNSQFEQAS